MINPINILSYFVKDITDLNKKKLYRVYIDYYGFLTICYNNSIIYYRKSYIIENYITNINKYNESFVKTTKIVKDFTNKFKQLYYKSKFKYDNQRSIAYYYHLKKYLLKHNICYNLKTYNRIKIRIIYYNMYKYKYKYKIYELKNKYKFKSMILFTNKYELNYINTFFRLYIY